MLLCVRRTFTCKSISAYLSLSRVRTPESNCTRTSPGCQLYFCSAFSLAACPCRWKPSVSTPWRSLLSHQKWSCHCGKPWKLLRLEVFFCVKDVMCLSQLQRSFDCSFRVAWKSQEILFHSSRPGKLWSFAKMTNLDCFVTKKEANYDSKILFL